MTSVVQGEMFYHPMGTSKVKLGPGDKVYQHKTFLLSYLIEHPLAAGHPDGQWTYVNKHGKPSKASNYVLDKLESTYTLKHIIPGKPVPKLVNGAWFSVTDAFAALKAVKQFHARLYKVTSLSTMLALKPDLLKDQVTLKLAAEYEDYATGPIGPLLKGIEVLFLGIEAKEALDAENFNKAKSQLNKAKTKFAASNIGWNFPISLSALLTLLDKDIQKADFAFQVKQSGLDLATATEEDYQKFAAKQGFAFASGLTQEMGRYFVDLKFLNPAVVKGVEVQDALASLSKAALFIVLSREVRDKIVPTTQDNAGESLKVNSVLSTYQNKIKLLQEDHKKNLEEFTPAQLNTYIKSQGGNYVGKMNHQLKREWIRWHLAGFPTATFALEYKAVEASTNTSVHVAATSNPGSPFNAEGMKKWKKLADTIFSLPEGNELFESFKTSQGTFVSYLSLDTLAELVLNLKLQPFIPNLVLKEVDASNIQLLTYGMLRSAVRRFHSIHWQLLSKFVPSKISLPNYSKLDTDSEPYKNFIKKISEEGPNSEKAALKKLAFFYTEATAGEAIANLANVSTSSEYRTRLLGLTSEQQLLGSWTSNVGNAPLFSFKDSFPSELVDLRKNLKLAFADLLTSGQITSSHQEVFTYNGKNYTLPVGTSVYKIPNGSALLFAQEEKKVALKSGYGTFQVVAEAHFDAVKNGYPWEFVFKVKPLLDFEQAKKELGVSKYSWMLLSEAEKADSWEAKKYPGVKGSLADGAILLKSMASPAISNNVALLPDGVKKVAYYAYYAGLNEVLKLIEWKLDNGAYVKDSLADYPVGSPVHQAIEKQFATLEDFLSIPAGSVSPNSLSLKNVAQQLGISAEGKLWLELGKEVWSVIQSKTQKAFTSETIPFVLTKTSQSLPGMHSKTVWADPDGNKWMRKAFSSDDNAKARIDAEHAANMISRLHGFRAPETRVMVLDGGYSYVQFLKPANGDLGGVPWTKLTLEQLIDVMSEHVLDWLISNHDSNAHNIMRDTQDKIFGIDKGQAFRFFPQDEFAMGYLPSTNPIPVYYDQYYEALSSGKVQKNKADEVAKAVLTRAAHMQVRQTKRHRELLELAFANRTNWPQGYTKAKFIDGLMDRKANLLNTVESLYKSLYKQGGLKWTLDVSGLLSSQLDEHVHVAVSEALAVDVLKSGTHGKALMVDSRDIEDSHILLYTEMKNGKLVLRGELSLLADADATVTQWVNKQLIVDKTGGYSYSEHEDDEDYEEDDEDDDYSQKDLSFLPMNDQAINVLIAYAKTVNTHFEDGGYNASTVNTASQMLNELKSSSEGLLTFVSDNPDKVWEGYFPDGTKFGGMEQQLHWIKMAAQYIDGFAKVTEAMVAKKKVKHLYPDLMFSKYVFEPQTKTALPAQNEAKSESSQKPLEEAQEGAEATLTSGTGKKLTVFKRKSTGTFGQFDPVTGQLVHQKGELADSYKGYEFDIESETGALVEYRSWTMSEVPLSQKGLMRFTVENWDGSKDAIEDVLDIIQTIGVNFSQADEESLELFYWRHLYGILQSRNDRSDGKWAKVRNKVKEFFKKPLGPAEELAAWRESWALAFGKKIVENVDYFPKFGHGVVKYAKEGFTAGKPYWNRPDFTLADLAQYHGETLVQHSVHGFSERIEKIIQSGGIFSTEERVRLLGTWYGGMSSTADQKKGSASFLFTRQNHENMHNHHIYLHPKVFLRTSNYGFDGDHFGKVEDRSSHSPFDLSSTAKFSSGSNELMIKNGVTLFDGIGVIVFDSASQRNSAITYLKKQGIEEMHGLPIDEIFVGSQKTAKQTRQKLWAAALAGKEKS